MDDEKEHDKKVYDVTPPDLSENEDRRRPKAVVPYAILWVICVLCVIFALVAMLNQG